MISMKVSNLHLMCRARFIFVVNCPLSEAVKDRIAPVTRSCSERTLDRNWPGSCCNHQLGTSSLLHAKPHRAHTLLTILSQTTSSLLTASSTIPPKGPSPLVRPGQRRWSQYRESLAFSRLVSIRKAPRSCSSTCLELMRLTCFCARFQPGSSPSMPPRPRAASARPPRRWTATRCASCSTAATTARCSRGCGVS